MRAKQLAGLFLAWLLALPGAAAASPNIVPELRFVPFPLTRKLWTRPPAVEPRPEIRAYIDGRVVHFTASIHAGREVVASGSGAFDLERAPVDCPVLALQTQRDSGSVYIEPGTREYGRIKTAPIAYVFPDVRPVAEAYFARNTQMKDYLARAKRYDGSPCAQRNRDCHPVHGPGASEAQQRDLEAGWRHRPNQCRRSEAQCAASPEGWKPRELPPVPAWYPACDALVVASELPDGSISLRAYGVRGNVLGEVAFAPAVPDGPWGGWRVVATPATVIGDVGVMTGQALLHTALVTFVYIPLAVLVLIAVP